MIGQGNHSVRTEVTDNMANRGVSVNNTNDATQANYPQVDLHTLEENIVSKVHNEVDSVMTTFETRVQDAVLTAIGNLVIPRVELVMKSANATSGWSLDVMYWILTEKISQEMTAAYK